MRARITVVVALLPLVLLVIAVNSPWRAYFTHRPSDLAGRSAVNAATTSPSLARQWAGLTQGDLGDPMDGLLGQMSATGISPALSQQGETRVFTYAFDDNSSLIFAAQPTGGQGLVLYYVDILD